MGEIFFYFIFFLKNDEIDEMKRDEIDEIKKDEIDERKTLFFLFFYFSNFYEFFNDKQVRKQLFLNDLSVPRLSNV
jgi:hypothetical protein